MTKLQGVLLLSFFVAFFYQWGATNLEGFLNYPFWRDMGGSMSKDAFIKLRVDHTAKIFPLVVLPFALALVLAITLVFVRPAFVPVWQVIAVAALQLGAALSTVLIQIPIQAHLSTSGFDAAAFDRLITTDLWFRKLPIATEAVLVISIAYRVVTRAL